ncbi:hypothetical protein B0A64_03750 [Flavobacterium araucananum]|uniref:Uncharacterized protein n=2 Tax=Flavobacterium araucananum TaxID=946678 RepID=A0A227PIM2_9FLAO|nr:hypothetical protein B0A64_03750 [Flavobacterium araucananum]
MFGEQWDLLWINTNYFRHIAWDGSPTSEIMGGLLNFGFVTQERDEVFLHNTTKAIQHETDRMEKGEIHFYSNGDKDLPIRKYKFSDAYIIHICVTFETYGPHNMQTAITLSPAIQNYGNGDDFIKYWQVSRVEAQPVYYKPEPEKKETRVKTIELKTTLDLGSANDTSGESQQGMLYGKTYEFKVVAFTQETPTDKTVIKWSYKYHSLSENKWIERDLSVTGDTLKFTLNEKDMCGRFVYIRAYIKDPENEGGLKVWKHNRFRWFDRMVFQDGLVVRKNNPSKINQHATSLCGTAALLYFYAQDFKNDFYNNYMKFFRTGEIIINRFRLTPNSALYDFNPNLSNLKYPHYDKFSNGKPCIPHQLMHQTDWIILAGTRSSSNKKYLGEKGEDWDAINWPSYMSDVAVNLYGASLVADETFITTGKNFSNKLLEIQKLYIQGWHIILLIDSDMLDDSISYLGCATQYHWIAFEGDLQIDPIKGVYSFSYYCWQNLNIGTHIRNTVFNTNFYGYIKFKK